MKCCLWLDGKKVEKASNIRNNFDAAALQGYLLGGSLITWLENNGGKAYADKLKKIDLNSNIAVQLEKVFSVKSEKKLDYAVSYLPCIKSFAQSNCVSSFGGLSSSSFTNGSFANIFTNSSFSIGSFAVGSFTVSSFKIGSFAISSFTNGSFAQSSGGSFVFAKAELTAQEYEKTIDILALCPLNKFGYGIHLI